MKSTAIGFALPFICLFSVALSLSSFSKNKSPEKGIYDGKVGNDQLILVAETNDNDVLKGYFVINRGKAVEESHSFSLSISGGNPFFQSDLYVGPLKSAKISSNAFEGTLSLMNKRKRFLFWRQKVDR